jgi:hypothetical protein
LSENRGLLFNLQIYLPFYAEKFMTVQKVEYRRLTTAGFMGLFLHGIIVAAPGAFLPQWTAAFGETVNIGLFYTAYLL